MKYFIFQRTNGQNFHVKDNTEPKETLKQFQHSIKI